MKLPLPCSALALLCVLLSTSARAAIWTELADAGNLSDPQIIDANFELTGIRGSIGGSDEQDVYGFQVSQISGIGVIVELDTNVAAPISVASSDNEEVGFVVTLYNSNQDVVAGFGTNFLLAAIEANQTYYLKIAFEGADPNYLASIFIVPVVAVPEPGSAIIFGGLVLAGAMGLRRGRWFTQG